MLWFWNWTFNWNFNTFWHLFTANSWRHHRLCCYRHQHHHRRWSVGRLGQCKANYLEVWKLKSFDSLLKCGYENPNTCCSSPGTTAHKQRRIIANFLRQAINTHIEAIYLVKICLFRSYSYTHAFAYLLVDHTNSKWWRFCWCNVYSCYFIYMFYKFEPHHAHTHTDTLVKCTISIVVNIVQVRHIYLIHWRWCYRDFMICKAKSNENKMNSIGKLWAR